MTQRRSLVRFVVVIGALLGSLASAPVGAVLGDAPAVPPAEAIAQQPTAGQAADLRMQLHHLLSEHTVLAGITTQKAATGAPDFTAAFNHLDQNSMLLSQFIGSVYGPEAAAQFLPLWRSHTQMYVDYTHANGQGNVPQREQARAALNAWVQAQSRQFAALNPGLPPDAMVSHLTIHVDGTLAAIDTFAQASYEQHYDIMHQAFEHSFVMGDALAMTIAQQFPDRFALGR